MVSNGFVCSTYCPLYITVIQKCIDKGMKVYTNTPALSLTTSSTTGKHTITTSRGITQATSVITTTNAFTSGLLSPFQNHIIPVRGTACSIQPAKSHTRGSVPGPLKLSYGLSNGNGAMDYMICRQGRGRVVGKGDQSYILGGAKGVFAKDLPLWYNNTRDDEQIPGAREYFEAQMQRRFNDWEGEEKPGNVDMVWTGGELEESESVLLLLLSLMYEFVSSWVLKRLASVCGRNA